MKKFFLALLVGGTLMSCGNNANDGDASTDTSTMDAVTTDTSAAALGDTSLDMNNEGTLSNPNTRTDVDTAGTGTGTQGTGTGTQGSGTQSEGSTNTP